MKKVLILALAVILYANVQAEEKISVESTKQEILNMQSWIIVYSKSENVIRVTDFSDIERKRTLILPEKEGLVFIKNIVKSDPSKVKEFRVQ